MTTRYVQARVSEEEFKAIKKKAIDLGLEVRDFLKEAALEKIKKEEESEQNRRKVSKNLK